MELKLAHIHDEGKEYAIRICMLVAEAIVHAPGSVIRQCDECGRDIWFDKTQVDVLPDGIVLDGSYALCIECTGRHALLDPEPVKWVGPNGEVS